MIYKNKKLFLFSINCIIIFNYSFLFSMNKKNIEKEIEEWKSAIFFNKIKKIESLIKNNFDVNTKIDDDTAITIAVRINYTKITKLLIDSKADINIKNMFGRTPLLIALQTNNNEISKLLISAGAKINIKDKLLFTPLVTAVFNDNIEMVKLLLNKGAYPTKNDIYKAEERNNKKIINLINNKLEALKKIKKELFDAISQNDINQVKKLLLVTSLGIYDENNNNPLHLSVLSKMVKLEDKIEIIKLILKSRKDLIFEKNNLGLTPIKLAISTGNLEILKLFIEMAYL